MRIVLQKVSEGLVDVVDEVSGEVDATFEPQRIGVGYVLLVGVEDEDGTKQVDWLAHKIANLRVFEDENGKMNRSIHDVDGSVLSISQFTLYADSRKGRRPSFYLSAPPGVAEPLFQHFVEDVRSRLPGRVQQGVFAADMDVSLTNWGPVTLLLDSADF